MSDVVDFGHKEARFLYSSYGTLGIFHAGRFDPLTRNLTTGALHQRGHHCKECAGARSLDCFKWPNPHLAFCSVWITRGKKRERCREVFHLKSQGCATHSKGDGHNIPLYMAFKGHQIDLNDFRDPALPITIPQPGQEDKNKGARQQRSLNTLLDELATELGYVPSYTNDTFYETWGIEEQYVRQQTKDNTSRGRTESTDFGPNLHSTFNAAAKAKRTEQMTAKQIKEQTKREKASRRANTYAPSRFQNPFKKTKQATKTKQISMIVPVLQPVVLNPTDVIVKAKKAIKQRYEEGER